MWVLPIECATSAHIAILFAMVMAILPLFFMLILSTAPCATAIGACATISCAAGNVYVEGYAVVLLTIMLTSAFLVRDFAALHCVTNSQRRLRAGLVMGSLGLQLTGIFPMHFSKHAPGTDNWYFYALSLHALGLVFAGTTLVNVPFVCFWRARHVLRLDAKRLTGIRVVYVSAVSLYLLLFFVYRSVPDTSDYCALHTSSTECATWANMTQADCTALQQLAPSYPRMLTIPTGHAAPVTYDCGWHTNLLSKEEKLLLPPAVSSSLDATCRKNNCTLYENARSIALEFGCLYLMAAYGFTFALSDVRWVLQVSQERRHPFCTATAPE